MGLEKKLSGKFILATGVFAGLKIPVEWEGKSIVAYQGKVLGPYTCEQAFGINRLIRKYDSDAHPLVLDIPTKEESEMIHVYAA